jgi:hypothetical protein
VTSGACAQGAFFGLFRESMTVVARHKALSSSFVCTSLVVLAHLYLVASSFCMIVVRFFVSMC